MSREYRHIYNHARGRRNPLVCFRVLRCRRDTEALAHALRANRDHSRLLDARLGDADHAATHARPQLGLSPLEFVGRATIGADTRVGNVAELEPAVTGTSTVHEGASLL